MGADELRAFLLEGTRTGKLAIVVADGSPRVTPVWFVMDGDDILFNTGAETLKGRSLRREPRVALCVDDDRPPFAYVRVPDPLLVRLRPDKISSEAGVSD